LRKSAQTVHLYRYRRFTMSVYVDQVVCCEAKTEARKRCCKLYDRATHGGRKHLKPASWITAKKLPALPISGYVCRGCRREFHKVSIFRNTDRMSFQCCIDVKRFRAVMKKFHWKVRVKIQGCTILLSRNKKWFFFERKTKGNLMPVGFF